MIQACPINNPMRHDMTDLELIQIVQDYAAQYKCSIADSIVDLEFDGPNGSSGPSESDVAMLYAHFDSMI